MTLKLGRWILWSHRPSIGIRLRVQLACHRVDVQGLGVAVYVEYLRNDYQKWCTPYSTDTKWRV